MNRRSFLAALAALPLVGRLVPKPAPVQTITTAWVKLDPGLLRFDSMRVVYVNGSQVSGTLAIQGSRDGDTWYDLNNTADRLEA